MYVYWWCDDNVAMCQAGGYQHESMPSYISRCKSTVRVQSSAAAEPGTDRRADWPCQRPLPVWRRRARCYWHVAQDEGDTEWQSWRKTICSWANGMTMLLSWSKGEFMAVCGRTLTNPIVLGLYTFCDRISRAGSGVVRIDPLRFLAGCHTRQLNQV